MKFINSPKYKILDAEDMSNTELANWFSFCNAIKFISLHCRQKNINPDDIELDSRSLSKYINTTAGDILTNLKEHNAIPMKYSLDIRHEDAKNIAEVAYN